MSHASHPSPALKVVVIGGGLGGLATAFAIARNRNPSISVTVLERRCTIFEIGAGISISPNAARIIYKWGLQKEFEAISMLPVSMEFRRYDNGKTIGNVWNNYRDFSKHMYGYSQGMVHRADLQEMLAKAAIDAGVDIQLDKRVDRVDCDSATPGVILQDGTSVKADLVIGADGVWSKTRSSIPANKDIKPIDGHQYTYRFLVSKEQMLSKPETAPLINDPQNDVLVVYAGPNLGLIGYRVGKNGDIYNVVVQVSSQSDAPLAGYSEPGDVNEMRALYSGFDETVRALLQHPESVAKWSLVTTPSLPTWSSSNGRVILIGDAAHAMLPWAAAGGSTTIEDAAVLGELLSSQHTPLSIHQIARGFEHLRRPRCERLQQISWENRNQYTMVDGAEQRARDAALLRLSTMQKAGIEDGSAWEGRPEPKMGARFPSPASFMWIYGFDAVGEARRWLAGVVGVDDR